MSQSIDEIRQEVWSQLKDTQCVYAPLRKPTNHASVR